MDFLEPLNQSLFLLVNADPATPVSVSYTHLTLPTKA